MKRQILTPIVALTALFAAFSVSACNTVRGVGQDVEATGEAVQDASTEAQQDLNDGK